VFLSEFKIPLIKGRFLGAACTAETYNIYSIHLLIKTLVKRQRVGYILVLVKENKPLFAKPQAQSELEP